MATVLEARNALNDLTRYGSQNFSDTQRDYALRWAAEKTAKVTGLLRIIGMITTANNDRIITHSLTRFQPGRRFAPAYISTSGTYTRLNAVALGDIQAKLDESTTTGVPKLISFYSQTQCMIYPIADGIYDIEVPYEQTAVSWTYGDAGATNLGLPDHIVFGGMLWGAKAYLMSGLDDGRTEEQLAEKRFMEFLEEVRDADIDLAPSTQPRSVEYDQNYIPLPGGA